MEKFINKIREIYLTEWKPSNGFRYACFRVLKKYIFKVQEGYMLPLSLRVIKIILFPIESIILHNNRLLYNPETDTFKLFGNYYSADYFRELSVNGIREGCYFKIVKRFDGYVEIERYMNESKCLQNQT